MASTIVDVSPKERRTRTKTMSFLIKYFGDDKENGLFKDASRKGLPDGGYEMPILPMHKWRTKEYVRVQICRNRQSKSWIKSR